jgi:hypothetical protein
LRRGDALAAKVGRCAQFAVGLGDERCPAVHRACNDTDLFAARSAVGVDRGAGASIGEINGIGEDGFHGAGAGVVDVPFKLHVGPEPLLEPALALPRHTMRDERLDVSDVWEMAHAHCELLRLRWQDYSDNRQRYTQRCADGVQLTE